MKLLTLLAAFSVSLFAQEPAASPAKATSEPSGKVQVRVDVLMVSVPEAKGLPLIPKLRDAKTVEATQAKLVEMIAAKEAELLDWPEVTTPDGSRSVSENIVEQRYPIEFEQPGLAGSFSEGTSLVSPAQAQAKTLHALGIILPTTFETRNVGATLECEARVSKDGSEAALQLAAQFVHLLEFQAHPAGKNEKGEVVSVQQPNFRTTKTSMNVTLRDGERRLILVGKPKVPEGTLFFFIAGVQIEGRGR